jgi:hypothetical protein
LLFGFKGAPQVAHVALGVVGSPIGVELVAQQVGGNVQEPMQTRPGDAVEIFSKIVKISALRASLCNVHIQPFG